MTFLVERLAELRRRLDHLRGLQGRVRDPEDLARDLSLENDVLYSLLTVCQLVIGVAGELASRRGERFETYRQAIRALAGDPRFPAGLVRGLEALPGFRNVLVHGDVELDRARRGGAPRSRAGRAIPGHRAGHRAGGGLKRAHAAGGTMRGRSRPAARRPATRRSDAGSAAPRSSKIA